MQALSQQKKTISKKYAVVVVTAYITVLQSSRASSIASDPTPFSFTSHHVEKTEEGLFLRNWLKNNTL